jgi:hypothetical protein
MSAAADSAMEHESLAIEPESTRGGLAGADAVFLRLRAPVMRMCFMASVMVLEGFVGDFFESTRLKFLIDSCLLTGNMAT